MEKRKVSKKMQKAIEARQKVQKEIFLKKLEETPIIQVACNKAGISRATYYRWFEKDEEFAEKVKAALYCSKETVNDVAKSKLISAIHNGEWRAIVYWLSHNDKSFMYKPEQLMQIEQEEKEKKERSRLKIIIDSVTEKLKDYKAPWQTNSKSGIIDDCGVIGKFKKETR